MRKTILLFITFILFSMNQTLAQNPDFLFMVEQAVKAPSGHNTQPWLFKLNESSIEIRPNFDKALPVVDPDNKELFISLGCATENLCIAATHKGYTPKTTIDDKGIITIDLIKSQSILPDPLFEQIAFRQTNRRVYNGKRVPADTIDLLNSILLEAKLNAYFYANGTPEFDSITNYVVQGNIVQMQDVAFREELQSWMRYNKKHQNDKNDGLSYAVFGAPNLPMFIVKPIMKKALNDKSQNKGDKKKMQSSSHFVLFTTPNNTVESWIHLGRTLERFLLKSTELGIVHAYLNQPNEVKSLSEEITKALNLSDEYPAVLLRMGYGEKMPYAKRKPIDEVII